MKRTESAASRPTSETFPPRALEAATRREFRNPYVPAPADALPPPPGDEKRAAPVTKVTLPGFTQGAATSPQSELWRVPRVARFLDVSRKRVYQLIAEGRLVAYRLSPRDTRVPWPAVEDYLRGCLSDPSDTPPWQ
jgi:excisionase family DNA binding protein